MIVLALDPVLAETFEAGGASIVHWLVTACAWSIGAWLVWIAASRRPEDHVAVSAPGALAGHARVGTALVAAAIAVAIGSRAFLQGEWKLPAEIARLNDSGPAPGAAAAALIVYYLAEVVVIVLLLRFGQACGERLGGTPWVPWGGLVLAATWGVVHFLLQGPSAGAYAIVASVLYGVVYALGPRRFWPSVVLVAVPFLL